MIVHSYLRQLGWNRRVLTFADFEAACEHCEILLILKRFEPLGEYYIDYYGQDVIVLDNGMVEPMRSMIAWHEFGHALMHVPGHYHGFNGKAESQADFIGLVALIPDTLLRRYSDGEISEQYGYKLPLIQYRRDVARYMKLRYARRNRR